MLLFISGTLTIWPCAAQVMLTVELQRRLRPGVGVMCFALHPGEVTTGITRTLPGPVHRLYRAVVPRFLLMPDQGTLGAHVYLPHVHPIFHAKP